MGETVYAALAQLNLLRPGSRVWSAPNGITGAYWADSLPRYHRPAQSALVGPGGSALADGTFWTTSGVSLGSSGKSVLVQVTAQFTDLGGAGRDVVTLAAGATSGGFAIVQVGSTISVYADNGGAQVLATIPGLVLNRWHTIHVLLDQSSLRAYLWVDGILRARSAVLSAWSFTGSQIAVLRSPYGTLVGMVGSVMALSIAQDGGQGATLPAYDNGTASGSGDAIQRIVEDYAQRLVGPATEIGYVGFNEGGTVGATTIAAGSNGAALPQSTIYVTSTAGWPSAGEVLIPALSAVVSYTSITSTTLVGCTLGSGTLATGQAVLPVPVEAYVGQAANYPGASVTWSAAGAVATPWDASL
jgi:hypothetical protein